MSERTGRKPLPRCKMILLCEGINTDDQTLRLTILGLIDGFEHSSYPAVTRSFVGFVWLTDGIGVYRIHTEFRTVQPAKLFAWMTPLTLIVRIDSNPQLS
jgi:hypothetical protein